MSSNQVPDYATQPLHFVKGKFENFEYPLIRDGLSLTNAVRFPSSYLDKGKLFQDYMARLNKNPKQHVAVFKENRDDGERCLVFGNYTAFDLEASGFRSNSIVATYSGNGVETLRQHAILDIEAILMTITIGGESQIRVRRHPFFSKGYLVLVSDFNRNVGVD